VYNFVHSSLVPHWRDLRFFVKDLAGSADCS